MVAAAGEFLSHCRNQMADRSEPSRCRRKSGLSNCRVPWRRLGRSAGGTLRAAPAGRLLRGLMLILALTLAIGQGPARAGGGAIRDTEIENDIRTMSASIFRAAGLEPNDVGIYLVQDNQLNSFVAGGQAIFMHTGLILRAETPNQLIGVVAHETGHIAGGHILRAKEAMHNASIESIIATVVGAAASVLGRNSAPMLADYPESDTSVLARYARAIAYYRQPDLGRAVPAIDALIRDFPNDPYYRELKGQMLFENGRIRDAIRPYEDAVRLAPNAPLLRMSLSQVYIETGDQTLNKRAIAYLNDASRAEGRESQVWRFLAIAYGRDNQIGMAALSLAEQALADGRKKDALQQATRAKQLLAHNTSYYGRAEDIRRDAENLDN